MQNLSKGKERKMHLGKKNAPRNFFQSFTEGSIYAVDSNSVCLIGRLHLCCFFLLYFLLSAIHKRRQ
jgi:hypothetical protein